MTPTGGTPGRDFCGGVRGGCGHGRGRGHCHSHGHGFGQGQGHGHGHGDCHGHGHDHGHGHWSSGPNELLAALAILVALAAHAGPD
eukprot:gene13175-biopygen17006